MAFPLFLVVTAAAELAVVETDDVGVGVKVAVAEAR